ncbi:SLATT domain-containing protein [Streptomyces sp. PSKA28]|uniref:SLATT domain-containing protein n=1 Tax=Streptomyces himalayensis subsp. himalayensis TaxID=2756131 RepID=A0A7W0DW53_9ACTN|nr:SLATT domain-containing protein [Streptomyces himalayensis subsp. himalayensis]
MSRANSGPGLYTAWRRSCVHYHAHRAAVEMVKSLCRLYMAAAGEFRVGVPNPEALLATRLEDGMRELRRAGWDAARRGPQPAGEGRITDVMRAVRSKSFVTRRDIYVRHRVQEQLAWYGGKSERSQRSAAVWQARASTARRGGLRRSRSRRFRTRARGTSASSSVLTPVGASWRAGRMVPAADAASLRELSWERACCRSCGGGCSAPSRRRWGPPLRDAPWRLS